MALVSSLVFCVCQRWEHTPLTEKEKPCLIIRENSKFQNEQNIHIELCVLTTSIIMQQLSTIPVSFISYRRPNSELPPISIRRYTYVYEAISMKSKEGYYY